MTVLPCGPCGYARSARDARAWPTQVCTTAKSFSLVAHAVLLEWQELLPRGPRNVVRLRIDALVAHVGLHDWQEMFWRDPRRFVRLARDARSWLTWVCMMESGLRVFSSLFRPAVSSTYYMHGCMLKPTALSWMHMGCVLTQMFGVLGCGT